MERKDGTQRRLSRRKFIKKFGAFGLVLGASFTLGWYTETHRRSFSAEELERGMVVVINFQRQVNGFRQLEVDTLLTEIAQDRSREIAANNAFGHYRPDGSVIIQELLLARGVTFMVAGENLAKNNYPDGQSVMIAINDLMQSPTHRRNILNSNYTRIGVGVKKEQDNMKYFTILFLGEKLD